jgi:hypothetical protein
VPGYFQAVPPGRVAGFIHLPGTSCQATFRLSLRNGSRVLFIFPALRARATFRLSLRDGSRVLFIFPALRARATFRLSLRDGPFACVAKSARHPFLYQTRRFVPGFYRVVPSSFVSPSHEKRRCPVATEDRPGQFAQPRCCLAKRKPSQVGLRLGHPGDPQIDQQKEAGNNCLPRTMSGWDLS